MLTPDGRIAEGSGENIFVVYGDKLITPPVVDGVLAGLTRDAVVTLARDEGYEVVEQPLVRSNLYLADEAFFTGTAAELVPLVEVDDRKVGTGRPGRVTRGCSSSTARPRAASSTSTRTGTSTSPTDSAPIHPYPALPIPDGGLSCRRDVCAFPHAGRSPEPRVRHLHRYQSTPRGRSSTRGDDACRFATG